MKRTTWMRNRMSAGARAALPVIVAAMAALAPVAAAHDDHDSPKRPRRSGTDFEWSGRVASGRTIEVKGVNGRIVAEAATGGEVEVVARKSGRRSDPDEVTIEVIEHAGGVTLCAVYPSPRGGRANVCAPGEGGRMSTKDNDVQVEFTVRVPAGVRFVGRTVNGEIRATGLRADAEAYTVNGSIDLSTRGAARATTVNGSIEARMGTAATEALEFETVNGGITLTLPSGSGAELRASTVNGDISTDFPITLLGKMNRRSIRGTIGSGGPQLMMTTVNGNIRVRAAS